MREGREGKHVMVLNGKKRERGMSGSKSVMDDKTETRSRQIQEKMINMKRGREYLKKEFQNTDSYENPLPIQIF